MRERHACICAAGDRRGDAGHDIERNAMRGEELELLAAPPEDERVAALEPDDTATEARMLEHDLVDALLRRGVTARFLADADARGVAAREREHLFRHEAVVQDDVRLLQRAQRIQRQQARIAGPGTDERDRTGERLVAHCQQPLQRALGVRLTAVTHAPGDVAAHQRLVEATTTGNVRQRRLDARPPALEHCRQRAE